MQTVTMEITPAIAKEWLKKNSANRSIKESKVAQYARDIVAGNWRLTHQGIAFYDDGVLADGQHRLKAIIMAGKPTMMMVTMNMPREAIEVLDGGIPRAAHDVTRLMGHGDWLNLSSIATARALISKFQNSKKVVSLNELLSFCKKHEAALKFSASITSSKKRGFSSAIIAASYVCAFLDGEQPEKLRRFAEIMYSGEISGQHENAAIRLREYLLAHTNVWLGTEKMETAKRVHKAIHAFCRDQSIERLKAQQEFKYNIPE